MRLIVSMLAKSLIICFALAGLFTLNQQVAHADELFLSGTTTGTFDGEGTMLLGLNYNNAVFSGTTSGGILVLDASPTPPTNINNLGSFTLNVPPNGDYLGNFTLEVLFFAPSGILGTNPSTFSASVFGNVSSDTNGVVVINFDSTPTVFSFVTSAGVGAFSLSINPAVINLGAAIASAQSAANAPATRQVTVPLTGIIRIISLPTATPEPTTLLLLGTGLAGVMARVRRRRKAQAGDNA